MSWWTLIRPFFLGRTQGHISNLSDVLSKKLIGAGSHPVCMYAELAMTHPTALDRCLAYRSAVFRGPDWVHKMLNDDYKSAAEAGWAAGR